MTQHTNQMAEIIGLSAHRFGMTNPIVTDVVRYWETLRQGRLLPERADVQPTAIMGALSHAFMLERTHPGAVRLRLAGAHLAEVMGMEVRGMPLRAFFALADRPNLMRQIETMFSAPQALSLEVTAETGGAGQPPMAGQMTILPLTDRYGAITRALGVFVTQGRIGLTPRRFQITQTLAAPIVQGRSLSAGRPIAPAQGLAEPAAPFQAPARTTGTPVLTVIRGGRD